MQSYIFKITGRVQGVWYRKTICTNAKKAGFNGYVKNLKDGSVEAGVSLDNEIYNTFISILEQGSIVSKVENITYVFTDEVFINGFEIR